ncbi:MAG: signal peptidase I [Candidatus Saccharibacteria bacterium]|nr:signal peptidase I [Candidatus Saccharibacteria bacterium]
MNIMKTARIIFRILSITCYAGIALYGLLYIPLLFGFKSLTIENGSMVPELNYGDLIYYQAIPREDIKVGTIVCFNKSEEVICHRVAEISEEGDYYTKADASETVDEGHLDYYQIEGKVAPNKVPIAGYVVKFINNNAWIVVIVAMIIVVQILLNLKKSDAKEEDEKKK